LILFSLYVGILLVLIYRTSLFGIFKDGTVSRRQLVLLFAFKAMAVPLLFTAYGGWEGELIRYDAGKYYHDAHFVGHYGLRHPGFFIRFLLGLQDDQAGSDDHRAVLTHLLNWNTGRTKDLLYNDNRIVIRLHALLDSLALGRYLIHALFSCLLSFIGIALLSRALNRLSGVDLKLLLLGCCLWPSLWFYTGGLLKEGPAMLVMGCGLWLIADLGDGRIDRYGWF
jgi:hypothetical protein